MSLLRRSCLTISLLTLCLFLFGGHLRLDAHEFHLGIGVSFGASFLGGEDWRSDLALVDAESSPGFSMSSALFARYSFRDWGAGLLSFEVSSVSAHYRFSEELDGETHDYTGSMRYWTVGPGFHIQAHPLPHPLFLRVGAITAFPVGRFVNEESSEAVTVVRRIPSERTVALHLKTVFGYGFPLRSGTFDVTLSHETALTGYFETRGWPRFRGHALRAGLEYRLLLD